VAVKHSGNVSFVKLRYLFGKLRTQFIMELVVIELVTGHPNPA
jgi:hypothetical protein